MLTILVSLSLRWWFLWAARRLAIAVYRYPPRDPSEGLRHLGIIKPLKYRPAAWRNGHHHSRIRLPNLQYQVVSRQPLAHLLLPMLGPQRRLEQGHRIARQQPQAERKQGRLGIAQRVN